MKDDVVLIRFSVQYDGSLLDPSSEYEYGPVLLASSSMKGRKKHYFPVKWANEAKTLGEWVEVELQLPAIHGDTFDSSNNVFFVRPDDTIGIQAKVTTPNEDGEPTFQSVGDGIFPFALEIAKKKVAPFSEWHHTLDLTFSMFYNDKGDRVKKGGVVMRNFSVVLASTKKAVEVAINPNMKLDEFSYLAENEPLISSTVRDMMVRSIAMFTGDAACKGTAFLPASEEVKRVHAPFYHLPAGLAPGMAFLMAPGATKIENPKRREKIQKWLRKIIGYALDRENAREETFVHIVSEQMKRTDNTYDDNFTQCAAIVGQALAIPPTALPYISDFVRTGTREKNCKTTSSQHIEFNNKDLHAVERFSEEAQNNGGDCEDGGCFACRIGNVLALNDWTDPLVKAASEIMKQYVVTLNLGSVRSAALGNDKKKKMAPHEKTVIDSAEDRAMNYGAHMWCEAVPLAKTVALIQRSVSDLDPNLLWLAGASRAPWTAALPHMVIEATGRLTSLLLPATEYVVTGGEEDKNAILQRIETEQKVEAYINENTVTFKQMKEVRPQEHLKVERDVRSTPFYRDTTHMFTTAFFENGLSTIDFIYANRGKRISAQEAWNNTKKFLLDPMSAHMRSPYSGNKSDAPAPSEKSITPTYTNSSLIPLMSLSELNGVTALVGNKTPSPVEAPTFFYGVALEDKIQAPLLPSTVLVPGTAISQREIRVISTLLRHSPPIDAPGDWDEINEMHEARIQSLLVNEGIDELAREKHENEQIAALVAGVRRATGAQIGTEWPTKASPRWTLKTAMFASTMFPIDQGTTVAETIASDVKKLVDKGLVKFARVLVEEPMPHRRNVVIQLLCNATVLD
jgi:hypothetical protein